MSLNPSWRSQVEACSVFVPGILYYYCCYNINESLACNFHQTFFILCARSSFGGLYCNQAVMRGLDFYDDIRILFHLKPESESNIPFVKCTVLINRGIQFGLRIFLNNELNCRVRFTRFRCGFYLTYYYNNCKPVS